MQHTKDKNDVRGNDQWSLEECCDPHEKTIHQTTMSRLKLSYYFTIHILILHPPYIIILSNADTSPFKFELVVIYSPVRCFYSTTSKNAKLKATREVHRNTCVMTIIRSISALQLGAPLIVSPLSNTMGWVVNIIQPNAALMVKTKKVLIMPIPLYPARQ